MAFTSANFVLYAGPNTYPINSIPTSNTDLFYIWKYSSSADDMATINTANYFNDASINGKVRAGDWIAIKATDGVELVWIALCEIPTLGGSTTVSVLTQSPGATNLNIWDDNGNIF